jgi:hypothetical protein
MQSSHATELAEYFRRSRAGSDYVDFRAWEESFEFLHQRS